MNLMRLPTALLCLGFALPLAGCFQAGATGDTTPGLTAAPAPAPAPDADTPAPAMPAGRGATAPKPPKRSAAADKDKTEKEEWWKEGGVTREKINGMCWMKYESGRKDMPVEKRADLVNQCVIDTLKEYPVN
jgi:hypothetical protein